MGGQIRAVAERLGRAEHARPSQRIDLGLAVKRPVDSAGGDTERTRDVLDADR